MEIVQLRTCKSERHRDYDPMVEDSAACMTSVFRVVRLTLV